MSFPQLLVNWSVVRPWPSKFEGIRHLIDGILTASSSFEDRSITSSCRLIQGTDYTNTMGGETRYISLEIFPWRMKTWSLDGVSGEFIWKCEAFIIKWYICFCSNLLVANIYIYTVYVYALEYNYVMENNLHSSWVKDISDE